MSVDLIGDRSSALVSALWLLSSLRIFQRHCSSNRYFINYNELLNSIEKGMHNVLVIKNVLSVSYIRASVIN